MRVYGTETVQILESGCELALLMSWGLTQPEGGSIARVMGPVQAGASLFCGIFSGTGGKFRPYICWRTIECDQLQFLPVGIVVDRR